MRILHSAAPDLRVALDAVLDAVSQLSRVTEAVQAAGPVAEVDEVHGRLACDPAALAGLKALEVAEAAIHAERMRLLVAAAGDSAETLNATVPRNPDHDCRVGDVRAVELAAVMGCTPNRARILLHEARTLVFDLPRVLAAVGLGHVTPFQSRLAAAAWVDLANRHGAAKSPVTADMMATFQTRILRRAERQTSQEFKRSLATAVAAMSPPVGSERPDPREARRVELHPEGNGMAWLSAYLDIAAASRVMQVLEHTARHDHSLSGTVGQRAADALVAIVDGASEVSPEARAQAAELQVLVSFEAMRETAQALSEGREPATALFGEIVGSGHIIEGQALLDLMGNARFRRLVVSEHTGQLLDFGRTTYRPPQALRDHVHGRDRTCRAPGCIRPARFSDVDHVDPWESGGGTDAGNLATLCRTHHVLKTHGGWDYTIDEGGGSLWRLPSGVSVSRPPGEYLDHVAPPTTGDHPLVVGLPEPPGLPLSA